MRNNQTKLTNSMILQRNISILLIIISFASCNPHNIETKSDSENFNTLSSVSFLDSDYRIDTALILSNQNLLPLIDILEKSDLTTYERFDSIPEILLTFLKNITHNDFSIANPGEKWQVGCVVIDSLPKRQLINLSVGDNISLLTYYTGGIAVFEHFLIFKYDNKQVVDFWCGNILADFDKKEDIIKYLKDKIHENHGLNSNSIYF